MLRAGPAQAQRRMLFKSQQHPVEGIEPRRSKQGPGILEGNKSGVEEGIKLGGEQEAVEDVEALCVGGAIGPWLGVAGAEEFG